MTTPIEALKEALRFIELLPMDLGRGSLNGWRVQVPHNIRAALAQPGSRPESGHGDKPWERGVLAELQAAAAAKWTGDPAAQRAGLFARAAAEIERLNAALAQPAEEPLTDEQIQAAINARDSYWATSKLFITAIARAIEAAHGIDAMKAKP